MELLSLVGYVLGYIVKENKVALVFRQHTKFGNNHYGLVGGKIDAHESIKDALVREMQEEIGITVSLENAHLVHVLSFKGQTHDCVTFVFAITTWQGEAYNKEPQKHGHMNWYSIDQLPPTLLERHKRIIEHIQKKQLYAQEGFSN